MECMIAHTTTPVIFCGIFAPSRPISTTYTVELEEEDILPKQNTFQIVNYNHKIGVDMTIVPNSTTVTTTLLLVEFQRKTTVKKM